MTGRPLNDEEWRHIWMTAPFPWREFFMRLAPPEQDANAIKHPDEWFKEASPKQ